MSEDRCVICGEIVPEGRMICPNCEAWKKSVPEDNWKRALEYCDHDVQAMKNLSHGEMVQIAEERRNRMKKRFYDYDVLCGAMHDVVLGNGAKHKCIDAGMILDLPKADVVERKKGKWHITDAYPHNVYCSECHKIFAQTHWAVWEDGSLPRNFCPNCGAEMEYKNER